MVTTSAIAIAITAAFDSDTAARTRHAPTLTNPTNVRRPRLADNSSSMHAATSAK